MGWELADPYRPTAIAARPRIDAWLEKYAFSDESDESHVRERIGEAYKSTISRGAYHGSTLACNASAS